MMEEIENSQMHDSYDTITQVFVVLGVAVTFIMCIFLLIRVYCKLTLVVCDCTTDMTGKTVIVTGANAGIGKFTAIELARKGARVIMGCRSMTRGQASLDEIVKETGNRNVVLKNLNLSSFASVRAFAEDILKTERNLHVLINNAGIIGNNQRQVTGDNCEEIMQSNYLGHFLLTSLVLDMLIKSAPSRIINVSSEGHRLANLNVHDLNGNGHRYHWFATYNRSKMAIMLFTRELSRRLQGTGVTVNSLHPGLVETEIMKIDSFCKRILQKFSHLCGFLKSPLEGAQTSIHLAISPDLRNVSGKYFVDCKQKEESSKVKNDERASELWRVSKNIVGLTQRH